MKVEGSDNFSHFLSFKNQSIFEAMVTFQIFVILFFRFFLNFNYAINLDEFHYLSYVFQFKKGILKDYFGTFHTLFFPILFLKIQNEVNLICIIRSFLFFLFLGNCLFTFLIARQFLDRFSSLFSVLCYISFSYVFFNACSFRYDSLCSFLYLFSLFLLFKKGPSISTIVLCAFLLSVSLMLTLKSIFSIISFLFIFSTMSINVKNIIGYFKVLTIFLFLLFLFFSILNLVYGFLGFGNPFIFLLIILSTIQDSYSKFIFSSYSLLNINYFLISLKYDFVFWISISLGFFYFFYKNYKNGFQQIAMGLGLFFPLLFLTFYRNSFPYFYLLIFSPPVIFSGFLASLLKDKIPSTKYYVATVNLIIIFIIISFLNILNFKASYLNNNFFQHQLVYIIHRIYPKPVDYIDGCSMISSFNKHGLFASSLGIKTYLNKNMPIFREIFLSNEINFLIANTDIFDLSKEWDELAYSNGKFLIKDDWVVLKENFIQHWGVLYVPGKKIVLNNPFLSDNFEILIPGVYTVEGEKPVIIDDILLNPGSTIELVRGYHKIFSDLPVEIILRFGNHLYKPNNSPITIENLRSKFFY